MILRIIEVVEILPIYAVKNLANNASSGWRPRQHQYICTKPSIGKL